jgi:chromosome segregation ATPase
MHIFGFFDRRPLAERMAGEIEQESERHRARCRELHEEFLDWLRRRDRARADLAAVDEEMRELQGAGITLLGRLNAATTTGDEGGLAEFEQGYKKNSKQLDKVGRRRDKAARRLAALELDEREVANELARDAAEVVEEHAARTQEIRERLEKLLVMLDEQHEAVAKAAVPMLEEHERRQPQKELEEG